MAESPHSNLNHAVVENWHTDEVHENELVIQISMLDWS